MTVQAWLAGRLPTSVLHLDAAACGRVSRRVLDAELAHLAAEAHGGYVAEAAASAAVDLGRGALGAMVGLTASDVAFCESGGAAFGLALEAWPLPRGARIGTVSSEYGANAAVLARLAALREWTLVPLPVDPLGRVLHVPADLDLVTFPQVASQRGVAQPVGLALDSGVPLLLDVAQSLGQCQVPPGAAAYVGTSRKWLCGPRGVGFLMINPAFEPGLTAPPTLAPALYDGIRRFESQEAHVAGRVGLATAAVEWTSALLRAISVSTAAMRQALTTVRGWQMVEPLDEPTGITTLRPPPGVDPVVVRSGLLERGIVVSAVPRTRAADLTGPVLRVSTAGWVTAADAMILAEGLRHLTVA